MIPVLLSKVTMGNGLYGAWRNKPFPTMYASNKTPVTADVLEAGFIYAAVILFFSFLVVLPGVRGKMVRIHASSTTRKKWAILYGFMKPIPTVINYNTDGKLPLYYVC